MVTIVTIVYKVFYLYDKVYIWHMFFLFMRRIQTQADIKRKKRKNQIIVGSAMIFLLFGSILGYSLMSGSKNDDSNGSKVSENGIEFFRQNGLWVTEIDGNVFGFQNLPSEVSDIDVNISISLEQYSGQPLYFVNPAEGASEILNNIGANILRYQESCFGNMSCEGDLPVKDCNSNLIIFEVGNVSRVYQNNSCIFIVGDSLRATDAFLYKALQII